MNVFRNEYLDNVQRRRRDGIDFTAHSEVTNVMLEAAVVRRADDYSASAIAAALEGAGKALARANVARRHAELRARRIVNRPVRGGN